MKVLVEQVDRNKGTQPKCGRTDAEHIHVEEIDSVFGKFCLHARREWKSTKKWFLMQKECERRAARLGCNVGF